MLLVGKPEGKKPLGRLRRRWVDNIKIDLSEIGLDWSDSGQIQLDRSCDLGNGLSGSIKCWETIEWLHKW
jgi:hypothetical protein